MNPTEDHLDVLQNIEFAVVEIWRKHPEMTNYTVMRAYDAAIAHYRALDQGQTPKPINLTGLDAEVFGAVKEMCEWRLGRAGDPQPPEMTPLATEDLVACLRKLRKSVDHWTKAGGRQGYLQLLDKYVR